MSPGWRGFSVSRAHGGTPRTARLRARRCFHHWISFAMSVPSGARTELCWLLTDRLIARFLEPRSIPGGWTRPERPCCRWRIGAVGLVRWTWVSEERSRRRRAGWAPVCAGCVTRVLGGSRRVNPASLTLDRFPPSRLSRVFVSRPASRSAPGCCRRSRSNRRRRRRSPPPHTPPTGRRSGCCCPRLPGAALGSRSIPCRPASRSARGCFRRRR